MGKIASGSEPRELIPAGGYLAVVAGVYDIGKQTGGQYGDKSQFVVNFELHKRRGPVRDARGSVLEISDFINFYLGTQDKPAKLRDLAQALEGRNLGADPKYDIETALGKSCRLQVVHKPNAKGEMKARISNYAALDPDDDVVPTPVLDQNYFEITPEIAANKYIPDYMPKFVADAIQKSVEFGGATPTNSANPGKPLPPQPAMAMASGGGDLDDEDIPF